MEPAAKKPCLGGAHFEKGLECLASVILEGIHDAALWDAFERWSEDFQLDAAEIQKVVVGLGPGSHAGVRHAIAALRLASGKG